MRKRDCIALQADPTDPEDFDVSQEAIDHATLRFRLKRLRTQTLNLSQDAFAEAFNLPVATLRNFEQARCRPDAALEAYLKVIVEAPDLVRKALAA